MKFIAFLITICCIQNAVFAQQKNKVTKVNNLQYGIVFGFNKNCTKFVENNWRSTIGGDSLYKFDSKQKLGFSMGFMGVVGNCWAK